MSMKETKLLRQTEVEIRFAMMKRLVQGQPIVLYQHHATSLTAELLTSLLV